MAEVETYKPKSKAWSYTKTKPSYNDEISNDVESTVRTWKVQGYTKYNDDLSDFPINTEARYITQRKGEIKARLGGLVIDNINGETIQYLKFINTKLGRSWSVQYSDLTSKDNELVGLYVKKQPQQAPPTISKAKKDLEHILVVPSMPAFNF